jgi:hypothetical protein
MGVSPVVGDLHDDPSAACMNRIGDEAPTGDLFFP